MSNSSAVETPIRGRVLARVLAEDLDKITGGMSVATGTITITCNDQTGHADASNICGEDGD